MKLCLPEKLTLLALRAGPCTREQLKERFGNDHKASHLVGKGLARMHDEVTFVITSLGREHCPKRRDGLSYQKGRPPKQSIHGVSDSENHTAEKPAKGNIVVAPATRKFESERPKNWRSPVTEGGTDAKENQA